MCFLNRRPHVFAAVLIGLTVLAPTASAQIRLEPTPPMDVSHVEGAIGLSINSLGTDVNAGPQCAAMALPCTHKKVSDWGGFGLDGSVAVNMSRQVAVVGAVSAFAIAWDSPESVIRHRSDWTQVLSFLAGPRIGPGFSRPHGRNHEADRFFVQALAGVETSSLFSSRPVVQVGGGVDSHGFYGRAMHNAMTLRMEFDYRITPGTGNPATRYRFVFGAVFGPRFGG